MRLLSQKKLHFQQGSSDKVYEVDLCEAGEGEFIVNFRYGRSGARLQEGTKTAFPVDQAKARAIFDELVASKIQKGYRDVSTPPQGNSMAPEIPASTVGVAAQILALSRQLERAARDGKPNNWKLSRVLWRAGELRSPEFSAALLEVRATEPLEQYSLAWSLGKSRHEAAIPRLKELAASGDEKVRRIATEALLLCLDEGDRKDLAASLRKTLPDEIRSALENPATTAEALTALLENRLRNGQPPHDYFSTLYTQAGEFPVAREAVYHVIRTLPFQSPWFRAVRHIFKAAEFRLDSEMYGLIAWRFEKSAGQFHTTWEMAWDQESLQHVNLQAEYQKPDCRYGFSHRTRNYMRRRVCRTMRRFGELNDPASFIPLALGVLMSYDDETDQKPVRSESRWSWDSELEESNTTTYYFGPYAGYLPLNFLLFHNSDRYTLVDGKTWRASENFVPGDEPGTDLPPRREEAFPHLWNAAPDALEHLLKNSRCGAVHEFAAKAWRDNPAFDQRADPDFIAKLVSKPYQVSQELGIDLAKARFDPSSPNQDLILALLGCVLGRAREIALGWVRECRKALEKEGTFLARAILIRFADVHSDLRAWIGTTRPADDVLNEIIPEVIGGLLTLDPELDEFSSETARNARETLLMVSGDRLGGISRVMVRELFHHPEPENHILAAQSLSLSREPVESIPDELWELMLTSDCEPVREIGMGLFARLNDEALLERAEMLASFCLSPRDDIRKAARPIVERLANQNPGFGQDMVLQFYPLTLRKEELEGLHDDVYELLAGPLNDHLHAIPSDSCFKMMESRYPAGQRLGFLILEKYVGLDEVPMRRVARLASQDHKDGREHIWSYYRKNAERIKRESPDALRILDSDWDDTREFAFDYFRSYFSDSDWTPQTLVGLCDSVRGDVQDYGREMITRFFAEENGQEYLLKLSQHPTAELQTFATNYLERFAAGDIDRIRELEPYFTTVLSQINKARVAKDRVFHFLEKEAAESREIAGVVMPILARISATVAIKDKADCIRLMRNLGEKWKDLESPLTRIEPPIHQSR